MRKALPLLLLLCLVSLAACSRSGGGPAAGEPVKLRIGYFAAPTHAQAVIGLTTDTYQRALGDGIKLEATVFSAGPAVIEAMFAGELDLAYVGPSPAVNGYVKSRGQAFRVVAGAADGGAVLVTRPGLQVRQAADLDGKRVATPQLGNTQDVALRHFLRSGNRQPTDKGGTVQIMPIANPEIVTLFNRGELDAAWVPEPWGARLVQAGGVIAIDERDLWPDGKFATTVIIASNRMLQEYPEIVRAFLGAHVDMTRWIAAHPDEARPRLNDGLAQLMGRPLPPEVLADALSRVSFGHQVPTQSILTAAGRAYDLGFLGKQRPDLSGLFDLRLLEQALQAGGRESVHEQTTGT